MRLIDADKLKECYTGKNSLGTNENDSKADYASIRKMIDSQPTSYDVDKVVEEVEKKMFTADLYEHGWNGQTLDNLLCYGEIHEILKGGLEG